MIIWIVVSFLTGALLAFALTFLQDRRVLPARRTRNQLDALVYYNEEREHFHVRDLDKECSSMWEVPKCSKSICLFSGVSRDRNKMSRGTLVWIPKEDWSEFSGAH